MYRKILLASVGAIALSGSAALAADLPSKAPPPPYLPPPPIFTWTGIYVGGQIGYAWGTGTNQFTGFDPFFRGVVAFTNNVGGTPNGVIGGAHVGYQYQIPQWSWFSSSGVVIGLEGTVDGTSLRNTAVAAFADGTTVSAQTRADVQGSIRGRLGVAWDRALIYGRSYGGASTRYPGA
jgi:outer membrane immunogenic protein